MIIGVCGPARTGKDTVAACLAAALPAGHAQTSTAIRQLAVARGLLTVGQADGKDDEARRVLQALGIEGNEKHGPAHWTIAALAAARMAQLPHQVVTGIRWQAEVDYLVEQGAYTVLLKTRHQHLPPGLARHPSETSAAQLRCHLTLSHSRDIPPTVLAGEILRHANRHFREQPCQPLP